MIVLFSIHNYVCTTFPSGAHHIPTYKTAISKCMPKISTLEINIHNSRDEISYDMWCATCLFALLLQKNKNKKVQRKKKKTQQQNVQVCKFNDVRLMCDKTHGFSSVFSFSWFFKMCLDFMIFQIYQRKYASKIRIKKKKRSCEMVSTFNALSDFAVTEVTVTNQIIKKKSNWQIELLKWLS